ncbi:GntR family transcriptional regulator [Nocardioides mangrovicus]|uniref:GntR family transcriptional regulator n=1 Tax=Nocardioides mangrovicus TaxID=2478913 RepID=A0A3L8NYK7_9ACTN|nr:GntR family transcriptional regulator [Nocardioides mangrovicus]RLV47964.1 GntR family transcriptional regulator [Nocardioides mangrovicus]
MIQAADEPAPAGVASRRIADHVRAQILAGELEPGTRIRQDDLARELAASRLPVREALRILETAGLVTLHANRGAWVTRLDQRDCEQSYQIRERIEPLLLRESAPLLTAEDLAELDRLQVAIESTDDVEQFLVLDRQLHWTTYRHAEARELVAIIERLWDTTQHYRRAFSRIAHERRRWIIDAEHRLLIQALRDGDVEEAERVLEMHIRRTRVELQAHPEVFSS